MRSEKLQKYSGFALSVFTILAHFFIQRKYRLLPLMGDETYYSSIQILEDPWNWAHYSFGHPPGWHYINAVAYSFFGANNWTAHNVGFFFSSCLLLFFLIWGWKRQQPVLGAALAMILVCHEYFMDFGSANHPVIATALFGLLCFVFANQQKWLAFMLCLTMALMIRESSLVYLLGALFFVKTRRQLAWFIPPSLAFIGVYSWYFLIQQKIFFSNQAGILAAAGESAFALDINRLLDHFSLVFILFENAFSVVLILTLLFYLRRPKFLVNRFFLACMSVFIVHTLFFGFYKETGLRLGFLASSAVLAMLFDLCARAKLPGHLKAAALALIITVCLFDVSTKLFEKSPHFVSASEEAQIFRQVVSELENLKLPREDAPIITTNPFHSYLNDPYLGFVDKHYAVHWHGGAPGFTTIADVKVAIIHNPPLEWPEQEILEFCKAKNFVIIKEIQEASRKIQIWADPGVIF